MTRRPPIRLMPMWKFRLSYGLLGIILLGYAVGMRLRGRLVWQNWQYQNVFLGGALAMAIFFILLPWLPIGWLARRAEQDVERQQFHPHPHLAHHTRRHKKESARTQ